MICSCLGNGLWSTFLLTWGARNFVDAVSSLPSGSLTIAYFGFASISSTSSTNGSNLDFRTCRFSRTKPGVVNQVGTEVPLVDRRWLVKRRSCGVALVAVHNNDLIECRASCNTVLLRNNLTENAFGTRLERVRKCVLFAFHLRSKAFQFAFHFDWNASRNAFQ